MKTVLFFTSTILLSIFMKISPASPMGYDFESAWKQVETLENNGFREELSKKLDEIYDAAQAEEKVLHAFSAFKYKMNRVVENNDSIWLAINTELDKKSNADYLSLIYAFKANIAAGALQFQERSRQTDVVEQSEHILPSEMSPVILREIVYSSYFKVLENTGLTKLKLDELKAIEKLRNTQDSLFYKCLNVYDIVLKDFIDFMVSDRGVENLTDASFTIKNFLAPKAQFLDIDFGKNANTTRVEKVAALYQKLLQGTRDQLLQEFYIDKIRLDYFKSVFADQVATSLYHLSFEQYINSKDKDVSLLASLELLNADLYKEEELARIFKVANDLKKSHANSQFSPKIDELLAVVTHKTLDGRFKKVYSTKESVIGKLDFKNLDVITYSIYRLPLAAVLPYAQNYDNEEIQSLSEQGKKILSSNLKLKSDGFKKSKAKMDLGKMGKGSYLLEMQGGKEKEVTTSHYLLFQVSDLILSYQTDKGIQLYVNDRNSGKPLKNVKVEYYNKRYRGDNTFVNRSESKTDEEGKSISNNQGSFALVANLKKDTLITIEDQINIYSGNSSDGKSYKNTIIYTDRAIYRPGQTVFFKALLNDIKQNSRKVVSGFTLPITIHDANGEILQSFTEQKTNSFGTVAGSFVIPKGRLNGYYNISTPFGGQSVRVEEYKRPSFEVLKFDRKKGKTRNDITTIEIKAIGLAGNPITDAQVKYRVERSITSPRCYWWFPQENNSENIKTGIDKTNAEGHYMLSFSDSTQIIPKPINKVIFYTVHFDVTDQAGETQHFAESFTFSDQALYLVIQSENQYDVMDNQKIVVEAFNADMDSIQSDISLKIYKEKKAVSWRDQEETPEFEPYYYQNAHVNTHTDLSKMEVVQSHSIKSGQSLDLKVKTGRYLLVAQSIHDTSVYIEKWITITDFKKKNFPQADLIYTSTNGKEFEPGAIIKVEVGSPESVYTRLIIKRGDQILRNELIKIKKAKTISYTIQEADRGGIKILLYTILENKVVSNSLDIQVPWSNKVIDLKIESFRDKVLPGSIEEIKLSLLHKGKAVDVELMATLFDASLEMLQVHSWLHDFYGANYAYVEMRPLEYGWRNLYKRGVDYIGFSLYYPSFPTLTDQNQYYYGGGLYRKESMQSRARTSSMPAPPQAMNESADGMMMDKEAESKSLVDENQTLEIRENLNELVFFYPNLQPDKDGKVTIQYKMNDALTRWKLMVFAHDKEMKVGYSEALVVTQKPLMIKPNKPRLMRFGDQLVLTANVSNLSENDMQSVICNLDLKDFIKDSTLNWTPSLNQEIVLKKGETKAVFWSVSVPEYTDVSLLQYTMSAATYEASDAERDIIPIVTDKILITEAIPFNNRALEEKTIKFDLPALKNGSIEKVALEYTSDPAWTAFVALPSLNGARIESAGELMKRIYSDRLGLQILQDAPDFKKALIAQLASGNAFQSKLQENEDLKYVLLQATPYMGMAKAEVLNYEGLQKFLNINNVENEINGDIIALQALQNSDGGFSWQKNQRSSTYITANILRDIARLQRQEIEVKGLEEMVKKAAAYILKNLESNYLELKKRGGESQYTIGGELWTISLLSHFYNNDQLLKNEAFKFYFEKHMTHWNKVNIYNKATLGMLAMDFNKSDIADNVLKYFEQTKRTSEEMGAYWEERSGFGFYQMPIGLQADIIDFYVRKGRPNVEIDEMKIWLIKNKQVNSWINSYQTADAVYGLLLKGSKKEAQVSHKNPTITLNELDLPLKINEVGYLKNYLDLKVLKSGTNQMKVKNNAPHLAYGGIYLQYWQKAENVAKKADNPLRIKKELYKEVDGKNGKELIALKPGEAVHPGDILTSRILITVDRDMDFITLTDLRPSGFEPLRSENAYGFWNYPSYSQDITDYQANYFFQSLPKGTKVLENKIIAVHKGNFSGGLATIQSTYSPEFTSHSEGLRVKVD